MPNFEIAIDWQPHSSGTQYVEVEAESITEAIAAVQQAPLAYFDPKDAQTECDCTDCDFEISGVAKAGKS